MKDYFPKLAGSYYHLNHPALEFVKSLCHVYGYDSAVVDAVGTMKVALLSQLQTFRLDLSSKNLVSSLFFEKRCCDCNE